MSHSDLYNVCRRYHGKNVRIICHDGRVHVGEITRLNSNTVWIRPTRNLGGYGYGFFGGYGGYGRGGYGYAIGLGTIAAIFLAAAFLW